MTVHITNTLEPAAGEDKILSMTQIYLNSRDDGGRDGGVNLYILIYFSQIL